MTDFPELQHALVDAARRRYSRRARARRAIRLVPVAAAACAVIAAIVLVIGSRPADREQAAPPRLSPSEQLQRSFAIFGRPATPADALPLSGKRLERFPTGRGDAQMDVGGARLALEQRPRRLYLVPAEIDGRAAVCASLFRGDLEISWFCGPLDDEGVVASAIPARFGETATIIGAAVDGVTEIAALSDGVTFKTDVRDNGVFMQLDRFPQRISWTDPHGHGRSDDVPAPNPDEEPSPGDCPRLAPLPADAEARAERLGLHMGRLQFPEDRIEVAAVGTAHGFVSGCGPAVAERTVTVTVWRIADDGSRTSAQYGFGRFDGKLRPWFSEGR